MLEVMNRPTGMAHALARCVLAVLLTGAACGDREEAYTTWRVYGGDPGSSRYSSLDEINTVNVAELEVAWVYHFGDKDSVKWKQSTSECNPIIIGRTLD